MHAVIQGKLDLPGARVRVALETRPRKALAGRGLHLSMSKVE